MPFSAEPDSLDSRLARVLETAPVVTIPEGFAARVAVRAATLPAQRRTAAPAYGTLALWGGLMLLVLAMLLSARWLGSDSSVAVTLQAVFALEFILLAAYVALRPASAR